MHTGTLLCGSEHKTVTACHLPGADNTTTDALSRNNTQLFFALNLQVSPISAIISMFNKSFLWTSLDCYIGSSVVSSTRSAYKSAQGSMP